MDVRDGWPHAGGRRAGTRWVGTALRAGALVAGAVWCAAAVSAALHGPRGGDARSRAAEAAVAAEAERDLRAACRTPGAPAGDRGCGAVLHGLLRRHETRLAAAAAHEAQLAAAGAHEPGGGDRRR